MEEKKVIVKDKIGLHARTAAVFADQAKKFSSDLKVIYGAKEANAKSMLGLMGLGVGQGKTITIRASGSDELNAVNSLIQFVEKNFE